MKKRFLSVVLILLIILSMVLTSCDSGNAGAGNTNGGTTNSNVTGQQGGSNGGSKGCSHNWIDATCSSPKTCSKCSATEGQALEHSWIEADFNNPKTCRSCGATEGERIINAISFIQSISNNGKYTTNRILKLHSLSLMVATVPINRARLISFTTLLPVPVAATGCISTEPRPCVPKKTITVAGFISARVRTDARRIRSTLWHLSRSFFSRYDG